MFNWLAKLIYIAGAKKRNPSLWHKFKELKQTEFASEEELLALQLTRLKELLCFADNHSPYYKKVFAQTGFSPEKVESVGDLAKLPCIDKATLIGENQSIHSNFAFKKLMVAETSGTSGASLEFKRTEDWDSINRANVMRAYSWYGVNVWERSGYLWGYNIEPSKARLIKLLDWLQNRSRIFRYDKSSIEKFARKMSGASYIAGYSSMIFEVAKKINRSGISVPNIKMVKGTSEMILDAYQPEVIKAFGKKMVSEYGAAEAGLIAFECPEGNMHINSESVIVEVDENDEILVTNLFSHSFPIIRYRLGDYVTLATHKCQCGRAHPIIKEVKGRKGDSVIGKSASYPALSFYYVFKNIAIEHGVLLNYKAVQDHPGQITLYIEGQQSIEHETLVKNELVKYFSQDIECQIQYVDEFDNQLKKRQYFESKIKNK